MAERSGPDRPRRALLPLGWAAVLTILAAACSSTGEAVPATSTRTLTVATASQARSIEGRAGGSTTTAVEATHANVRRNVVYTKASKLDVYLPRGRPTGPVAVLFPGRTSPKDVYVNVADALAEAGIVSVVADYRNKGATSEALSDVRCAIDYAASIAARAGARADRLVAVGLTWGVHPAFGESFDGPWSRLDAPRDCVVDAQDGRPVGVVGVVGQYNFFDSSGTDSEAFRTFSPISQLGGTRRPTVRLLSGRLDQVAIGPDVASNFRDSLGAAGYDVKLTELDLPNLAVYGATWNDASKAAVADPEVKDRRGLLAIVDAVTQAAGN